MPLDDLRQDHPARSLVDRRESLDRFPRLRSRRDSIVVSGHKKPSAVELSGQRHAVVDRPERDVAEVKDDRIRRNDDVPTWIVSPSGDFAG
ncbi:hypothetical protein [Microbacterium lacticum]